MRPSITALITCLCFGLALTPVWAETYYVATNGLDAGRTGIGDWTNALATISNGVAKAGVANGNTVLVSNGTYVLSAQLLLTKATTVKSWSGRNVTIIDGNNAARCFYLNSTGTVVDGFTIINGNYHADAPIGGGGIAVSFTAGAPGASILNCIISNNIAPGRGGGVYCTAPTLITNCIISGNTATNWGGGVNLAADCMLRDCTIANNYVWSNAWGGGGIFFDYGGTAETSVIYGNTATNGGGIYLNQGGWLQNCIITNNQAQSGGGVDVKSGGTAGMVSNCVIAFNTAATRGGGALMNGNGNGRIVNCLIISNVANGPSGSSGGGGGVYCRDAGNQVLDCRIIANTATVNGEGGGTYVYATAAMRGSLIKGNSGAYGGGITLNGLAGMICTLSSCTIVSNRATSYGGGLYASSTYGYITNTIIASNTSPSDNIDIYPSTTAITNNYFYSCCPTVVLPASQGNRANDPAFVNAPGGNYHLTKESPCVNAGTNETWMSAAADLDGYRRIDRMSGRVDIGCYEYIFRGSIFTFR